MRTMLYFYCLSPKEKIKKSGLKLKRPLVRDLDALKGCEGDVLVINGTSLHEVYGKEVPKKVPTPFIMNYNPYLSPTPITAAGGYVVRPGKKEPEVLTIYRRGAWEMPKGKLDKGESIEECALREVREEVGIERLEMIAPAGATYHAYERKKRFEVKTTYWYLMHTPETQFEPQQEEQIEDVVWMGWSEALQRVSYPNYVLHMREITPLVMETDLSQVFG